MADIVELIYADHDWFRRQFFLLDGARDSTDLAAIWEPLATRLDTHAQAEEEVFYPVLLKVAADPVDETDDAIGDHNEIRDAVREARGLEVGTDAWFDAVGRARKENGEHLEEEEREGLADFIRSATFEQRHEAGLAWMRFQARHRAGTGVDDADQDPATYIEDNS